MIDPALLREDPGGMAANFARRGVDADLGRFAELDSALSELRRKEEGLRAERNRLSKEFAELKRAGKDSEAEAAKEKSVEAGAGIKELQAKIEEARAHLEGFMLRLPNVLHGDVPDGSSEADNREVRVVGERPDLGDWARDHVELGGLLGALDFETASAMSQARFATLAGAGATLHRALAQFMLDTHVREHGYSERCVPYMVNTRAMTNTGQLPKFGDDHEFFTSKHDDLHLIPTSEVPLANLVAGATLTDDELPLRLVAHSPCFRREAGSYGKDTRGMLRQHQFDKVELVQVTDPDSSAEAHEEILSHAERVMRDLGLPYRVVELCAGDTGSAAHRTFDIEAWLPGQGRYREISSVSNDLDFQARRMKARYRSGKRKGFVHILNGSGVAVGRAWIAVLENFQHEDGSVRVPEPLRPYMGGLEAIRAP